MVKFMRREDEVLVPFLLIVQQRYSIAGRNSLFDCGPLEAVSAGCIRVPSRSLGCRVPRVTFKYLSIETQQDHKDGKP